jgi:hypothetical protein
MDLNLIGRIDNVTLGQHRPLQPLFEAVVNSIHAIESLKTKNGRIEITVIRDSSQGDLGFSDHRPVNGFIVEDNGVGFDEANYKSFKTSDTKFKQGAKGIGRFTWLKAFDHVHVESVFAENGSHYKRTFDFLLTPEGIVKPTLKETDSKQRKTIVKLTGYKQKYQDHCPKSLETLAEKVIEHCLIYLLSENRPTIIMKDGGDTKNLNEIFDKNVKGKTKQEKFDIKGRIFEIINLRLYLSDETKHKAHFCANGRVVESINVEKKIPDLNAKLVDEENKTFKYAAYVSGEFLDENVNTERTDFYMSKESDPLFPDTIAEEDIIGATVAQAKNYLGEYLRPIVESKISHINSYVDNQAPQYRYAIRYRPEALEQIPPNLPDDKLDIELHRINAAINVELKERSTEVLKKKPEDITNLPQYIEKYKKLVEEITDFSQAQLSQYVIHRKLIIDLLEQSLKFDEKGKYYLEEAVHGIIFPLRTSSDNVDYEQQNLWIIDERLAYHQYLASDQRFDEMRVVEIDSKDRPDLMVFNAPLAYAEADASSIFSSVVIVEFKRPMRTDYNETDENPFEQSFDYIRKIRAGRIKDKEGRLVEVDPSTPFYIYVICDITNKIKAIADNYGFTQTPDRKGYFNFNKPLSAYVELISYPKLINDAKKRNRILFDKLHIHG